MVKKPRHDPATAWEPVNQALANYLKATAPGIPPNWAQLYTVPPGYTAQQLAQAQYVTKAQLVANSGYVSPQYATPVGTMYGAPVLASAPKIRWEDVQVRQTVDANTVQLNPVRAYAAANPLSTAYEFADGSEGEYNPAVNTITKTKAATPPAPALTPEEIEETTEVITAWRVFGIEDYKLRGTWSTWEGRVFHASCSCEEFAVRDSRGVTVLPLHPDRREDMRRHLAAGTGTCGVYSRKHLNPFWEPKRHYQLIIEGRAVEVLAQCVNYGLGYEYDGGYRSEYARIEHLWLLANGPLLHYEGYIRHAEGQDGAVSPATVAQILSTTYEVPCDVVTPVEFAYKQEAGLL